MIKGLGEKLIALRQEQNISQYELSKRIGLSQSVICAYENGERTPSIEAIIKLSCYYHVSIDYLLKQNNPQQIIIDSSNLNDEKLEMLKDIIKMLECKK